MMKWLYMLKKYHFMLTVGFSYDEFEVYHYVCDDEVVFVMKTSA